MLAVCENGHRSLAGELTSRPIREVRREFRSGISLLGDSTKVYREEFMDELESAPDRAAAILTASMPDAGLKLMIRSFAVTEEGIEERLLGPDQPLGGFGMRAHFCYYFGLISQEEWDSLKEVAKIRNRLAHKLQRLTFKDDELRDRTRRAAEILNLPTKEKFSRPLFNAVSHTLWSTLTMKLSVVVRRPTTPMSPLMVMAKGR